MEITTVEVEVVEKMQIKLHLADKTILYSPKNIDPNATEAEWKKLLTRFAAICNPDYGGTFLYEISLKHVPNKTRNRTTPTKSKKAKKVSTEPKIKTWNKALPESFHRIESMKPEKLLDDLSQFFYSDPGKNGDAYLRSILLIDCMYHSPLLGLNKEIDPRFVRDCLETIYEKHQWTPQMVSSLGSLQRFFSKKAFKELKDRQKKQRVQLKRKYLETTKAIDALIAKHDAANQESSGAVASGAKSGASPCILLA